MESKKKRQRLFDTLRRKSDFELLRASGKKVSSGRWLLFISKSNSIDSVRLGFSVSRKVGSAVMRNRLRRWGRETFQKACSQGFQKGLDLHVVFRPMEPGFYQALTFSEFERVFFAGLKKLPNAPHQPS